jgi:two-component system cell cycle response regulator DivK
VRLEESDERREQRRLVRPAPELIRPDSSQREEPLGPTLVTERCSKRCKSDRYGIVWFLVGHGLGISEGWQRTRMAKILIVEDNALNIKLFCDLLAAHGHEPEAVTDSRNALDVARDFEPDLVITDIQLPHVSGLELIRLLRADDRLAEVPIMAVTAYAARGDEERIRAAGAQAYVSKPISVVRFAETVEDLLKKPEPAAQA